ARSRARRATVVISCQALVRVKADEGAVCGHSRGQTTKEGIGDTSPAHPIARIAVRIECCDERGYASMENIKIRLIRDGVVTSGGVVGKRSFRDEVHIGAIFTSPTYTLHLRFAHWSEIAQHAAFQIVLVEVLPAARDRIASQARGVAIRKEDLRVVFTGDHELAATAGPGSQRRINLDSASIRGHGTFTVHTERTLWL